jgi:hypothetical protein
VARLRRDDVESSTGVIGSLLAPASNCLLVSQGYGLVAIFAVTCGVMALNNHHSGMAWFAAGGQR